MADHMTAETDADRLARYVRYYESAEEASMESRKLAERDRDYYDNDQWTPEELATLKKRKQPPITINRIKPKVNFLLGEEMQRRSLPRAYPRTPAHEQAAQAASDSLRFVTEDNRFDVTRSEGFKNLCIEGIAGADVSVVQTRDGYKVKIKLIPWDRIFFDPHSRERDFSDAKYVGQVVWMDYDDAVAQFPDKVAELDATLEYEAAQSDTYEDTPRVRWADPRRKRLRIIELWHKEGAAVYQCKFTKGGELETLQSPYLDEEENPVWAFVLGSAFIDRDGNRYGIVRDWIGIQDEINKRRSKALHMLSVRQAKGEKGAVDDVNKMRQELARPDGYVEVNPKMEFEILPTGDMAAAQLQLLQEAKQEIDAVGVNAALSGAESRDLSGRAIHALKESGLAELGPLFDYLRQWQLSVYRAIWCRIKQFWNEEKWIRVTDDENNLQWVGLNVKTTVGEMLIKRLKAQGREITPEMMQQAQKDPRMQQPTVENNIVELDVDIMIDDAPVSPTIMAEQFEQLMGLVEKGVLKLPPKAIIQASSLRNKQQLLKDVGADGPPPELRQAQEQIQKMGKFIESLQADKSLDARKLDLEEQKIGIDRMKVSHEMGLFEPEALPAPTDQMQPVPMQEPPLSEREALARKLENEKEMHRMKLEAEATMRAMEKNGTPEAIALQKEILAMLGNLSMLIQAPRERELIRDASGEPVGAVERIVMPEQQEEQGEPVTVNEEAE